MCYLNLLDHILLGCIIGLILGTAMPYHIKLMIKILSFIDIALFYLWFLNDWESICVI